MSTTVTEVAQAAQEQTLKALRQSQQAVVQVVRAWASAVEKAIPETSPALPFADKLPTAEEIVETSFGFAEELLKAQREFAENIVAAAAPVLPKPEGKSTGTKAS
jgi:hypothetical protein